MLFFDPSFGKLNSPPECSAATGDKSNRLFIKDHPTGWRFLIDSGAEVSILPRKYFKKLPRNPHCNLRAANQSLISIYGEHNAKISIGFPRPFSHCFLVADVKQPILGADFLGPNNLLIDLSKNRLLDSKTFLSSYGTNRVIDYVCYSVVWSNRDYPKVFHAPDYRAPVLHSVVHRIDVRGPLPTCNPRRLAPDRLIIAKREFDEMVEMGICRPSNSSCSPPLLMEALWRLPAPKCSVDPGPVWHSAHSLFRGPTPREENIYKKRSGKSLSPYSYSRSGYP